MLRTCGCAGLKPKIKRIAPTFPWSKLPPQLWQNAISASDPDGNLLTPPWPDILIAAGRQTVAPALAIKSANFNRTFCVQVQDPVAWRRRFDVIIAPRHDRLSGDNVVQTVGALTGITRLKLDEGRGTAFGHASIAAAPFDCCIDRRFQQTIPHDEKEYDRARGWTQASLNRQWRRISDHDIQAYK